MYFVPIKFAFVIVAISAQAINDNSNYDRNQESHYIRTKRADTEITEDPLPYLVKLGYSSPYGWLWICSGALVDPRKVVTSGICVTGKPKNSELKIVNVQDKNFKIATAKVIDNDIAVLLLEEPVDFVQRPVCLSADRLDTNTSLVAGWGGLSPENQLHGTLNKKAETITVAILIVGDKFHVRPTTELAPCVADRGGPLQIRSKQVGCSYEIIGVLKDWKDCGEQNSFGSYISLSSYERWIRLE